MPSPRSRRPPKRDPSSRRGGRDAGWPLVRGQQHPRAEPQPRGDRQSGRRGGEQCGAVAVVVEVVLGQPQRVVAQLVGEAGVIEQLPVGANVTTGRRPRRLQAPQSDSEAHRLAPLAAVLLHPVRSDAQDDPLALDRVAVVGPPEVAHRQLVDVLSSRVAADDLGDRRRELRCSGRDRPCPRCTRRPAAGVRRS